MPMYIVAQLHIYFTFKAATLFFRFIYSTAWPHMFGKPADDLQQAAAVGVLHDDLPM